MENRQLNFNQPLLSVRRYSSAVLSLEGEDKRKTENSLPKISPLPFYKSELKSGPMRKPGTVPFLWEQTPGRPKDENKPQTRALARPPISPKLPPLRILDIKQQASDKYSEGRAVSPSQTEYVLSSTQNVSSLDKNMNKNESFKDRTDEKGSSSSEDGDEAYLDALDTLSQTESLFFDCSVSGLSGLDGPNVKLKPSSIFSKDLQTHDFMMGRFLPAAKAMASETPKYVPRKQPLIQEQPRQIKKLVSEDNRRPLYHYRPDVSHYPHDRYGAESDDEDYHDEPVKSSAKACGFFSWFCLKNSFCLLSPVPGMRTQARVPASSVHRVQAKSSSADSCSGSEHARNAICEKRSMKILQPSELHEGKIELKSEFNLITTRSDCQEQDGSSLYSHWQGNVTSPYRDEFSQSLPHEEKGFHGISEKAKNSEMNGFDPHRKGYKIFQELLTNKSTEGESGSASPVAEKTLYIDAVHLVKSRNSSSSSSDMKGLSDYGVDDFEAPLKSREMEETPSVDYSHKNSNQLNFMDEKAIWQPKSLESIDSCFLSPSEKSCHDLQMDIVEVSNWDDNVIQDSKTLTISKVAENGKISVENQWLTKSGHQEKSHGRYSQLPLAPPLPKSPSESWLSHTLPAISSRKSSRLSLGIVNHSRTQASKTSSHDPKWETIVRTSNVHHWHLQCSEELLTPIPEA